jgi:hypothetical protein
MLGRRFTLAAALAAILAGPVAADTSVYVNGNTGQDGTGGHDGTTALLAWRTMSYTNANLPQANTANGHVVVYVVGFAGTFDALPAPALAPANGKRYLFEGSLTNAANVRFSGGTLSKTYVSVHGATFNGDLTFSTAAAFDSLASCVIVGNLTLRGRANTVDGCTVNGKRLLAGVDLVTRTGANVLSYNTFPNLGIGLCNVAQDGGHPVALWGLDSCRITRNHFTIVSPQNCTCSSDDVQTFQMYGVTYSLFNSNRWDITNQDQCPGGHWYALCQRDASNNNTFRSDTFYVSGGPESGNRLEFAMPTVPADSALSCSNTCLDSCLVKINGVVGFGDGMKADTVRYCQLLSNLEGPVLENSSSSGRPEARGQILIDHNTFMSGGVDGVVHVTAKVDTVHFTNNIVYATGAIVNLPVSATVDGRRYAASFGDVARFDSTFDAHYGTYSCADSTVAGGAFSASHLQALHNLYSYYGSAGAVGARDRSVAWFKQNYGWQVSAPGDGGLWDCKLSQDGGSAYGSPMFYDSTFATFDGRLGTGSAAITICADCGDAGANPYTAYAQIQLSLSSLTFDQDVSMYQVVHITNPGGATLTISAIASSHPSVTVSPTSGSVAAGADLALVVTYSQTPAPVVGAVVTIASNARDQAVVTIPVSVGSGNVISD